MLLELARDDGRWGLVHAFPATANGPSNGICRSLGFRFAGERDLMFAGRVLHSNDWVINPATDLAWARQDRVTVTPELLPAILGDPGSGLDDTATGYPAAGNG